MLYTNDQVLVWDNQWDFQKQLSNVTLKGHVEKKDFNLLFAFLISATRHTEETNS